MKRKNLEVGLRVVHKESKSRGYISHIDAGDTVLPALVLYDRDGAARWHTPKELIKEEKYDAAF